MTFIVNVQDILNGSCQAPGDSSALLEVVKNEECEREWTINTETIRHHSATIAKHTTQFWKACYKNLYRGTLMLRTTQPAMHLICALAKVVSRAITLVYRNAHQTCLWHHTAMRAIFL